MANEKLDFIRTIIKEASDEQLVNFLNHQAMGSVAKMLIDTMENDARAAWFREMKVLYPKYFEDVSKVGIG
jgi:hypothetical protein